MTFPLGDRPQWQPCHLRHRWKHLWQTFDPLFFQGLWGRAYIKKKKKKRPALKWKTKLSQRTRDSHQNSNFVRKLAFSVWTSWSLLNKKSLSRSDHISHATFFYLINKWRTITPCAECMFTLLTRALWDALTVFHLEMLIQSQRAPSSFTPCRVTLLRHALRSVIWI